MKVEHKRLSQREPVPFHPPQRATGRVAFAQNRAGQEENNKETQPREAATIGTFEPQICSPKYGSLPKL